MEYQDILNILAPCGLDCSKCFANADGEVKRLSQGLQEGLGAFDRYAERFSSLMPVFNAYPSFKGLLAFFAEGDCSGCRKGSCKHPNCGVAACHKEKGVDFCFQCGEFPCDKTNLDPDLERLWRVMNKRMRKVGVEAYYRETKDLPRYR